MVPVQVKVCGIRDRDGARACATAGVDFAGLNFVPGTRRAIDPERARGLLPLLGVARPVAVTRDAPTDLALRIARDLGVRWIQLHGTESPEHCEHLAVHGRLRVIKAITAADAADPGLLRAYAASANVLLVDGREPGSGRPWPWPDLAPLLRGARGLLAGVPWWLAGGLGPDNVAAGVAALRPSGVDAASGVERDGSTDLARVASFCRAARLARHGGAP